MMDIAFSQTKKDRSKAAGDETERPGHSSSTLTSLDFFAFLPTALAFPFFPALHSTDVLQPDWMNTR